MERKDYLYLVRLSEQASADNPDSYRRKVALFAALGYAWVLGSALLGALLVGWCTHRLWMGQARLTLIWPFVAGLGLLGTGLSALWLRLRAPEGISLTADQCPELFRALDKIRHKVKGPAIHQVLLTPDFNASISQLPRYGLMGGATNILSLGLPLMFALDRPRLLAVLAHEYGHLRGGHGTWAAWIYRTRVSWMKLAHNLRKDTGLTASLTRRFLHWYLPRFSARSFAVARQDEYDADRVAGRLLGPQVAAAALIEIEVKGRLMAQQFWDSHWALAQHHPLPQGPYRELGRFLNQAPDTAQAQAALREALKTLSSAEDTHPVLRDRLDSLDQHPHLPEWSRRSAVDLLGSGLAPWLDELDRQWCRDNASAWKAWHADLTRVQARVQTLQDSQGRNNADEMVEWATLSLRLDPKATVTPIYEEALRRTADHPRALQGLIASLPASEAPRRLALLERLYDLGAAQRWWACQQALGLLGTVDTPADTQARWRQRLKDAEAAEQRAWEELQTPPVWGNLSRHDLNPFELSEWTTLLSRQPLVQQAWLARKELREFPYRRTYVMVLQLSEDIDPEDAAMACETLADRLPLPGRALVLCAGLHLSHADIRRHLRDPLYVR